MKGAALVDWYGRNHRCLPWRETRDPYRIWLSEVILQQTRVAQGMVYYLRFTERFPSVAELAGATEDEVLKLWQGLGYYSRARNLHAAAREVMERHGGVFPSEYKLVRGLRGVGDYTAAAVASFCGDAPFAVVDGNVYRVLSRVFDLDVPIDSTGGKRVFAVLAQGLLDEYLANDPLTARAGLYNQAMMELGALVCTPRAPNCGGCPMADCCLSLKNRTIALRPVKEGKARQVPRFFNYLHLTDGAGTTLLYRRGEGDIWQGLYEFPLVETPEPMDFEALRQSGAFEALLEGRDFTLVGSVTMPKHVLSHRIIYAVFHRIAVQELPMLRGGYIRVGVGELNNYAIARLTELYMERAD